VGSSYAFLIAFVATLGWAAVGPIFGFSDVWQLWANTATTVITFLMVFLIQSSQNNDTTAIHAKLNEILYSIDKADNALIGIEKRPDKELHKLANKTEKVVADDSERRTNKS
jgi:low affinity Fe/Cu permease